VLYRYDTLPEKFVVGTIGGGVAWVIGGLGSAANSSIITTVADGAIDLFYDRLLPAFDDLKTASCNVFFSVMNITQAEAFCSASSLYTNEYLQQNCAPFTYASIEGASNLSVACTGVNALGGNVELLSTLCSGNNTLGDMYASCLRANATFGSSSGLPSAETMKTLVRVSLNRGMDAFISFITRLFDSGIQYMNDIWIAQRTIQPWMVQMAFGISGLLAFIAAIFIASAYFPSIVATTLKYRCGVIPSLRDPDFAKYRQSVQWVTLILGGMFWYVERFTYVCFLHFSVPWVTFTNFHCL